MGQTISNKKHYLLNLSTQNLVTIVSVLIAFFSAPISLNYWLAEKYGIWAIVTSFTAYLSMSGLGIDVAAGILMTKNGSYKVKRSIFKKSIFVVAISVVIFSILFLLVNIFCPSWYLIIGKMSPDIILTAKKVAIIFIISFLINLPFGVISNTFAAYQKAFLNNIFQLIQNIIVFLVLIITIFLKKDLIFYSLSYGVSMFCINILKTITYWYCTKPFKNLDKEDFSQNNDEQYSTLIKTGLRLSFYGLAVLMSSNISNLIISNKVNVASVTPYALNYKLFFMAFTFISAINLSAAPLLGKEYAKLNWEWIKKAYDIIFLSTISLGGLLFIGGMLFFHDFLLLWVGQKGYSSFQLIMVLGLYFFVYSLSNLNYVVINSLNFTKGIGFISWAEAILFILFSFLFVGKWGILGVAAGMLGGAACTSLWILPLIVYRRSQYKLKYNYKFLSKIIVYFFMVSPLIYYIQTSVTVRYIRIGSGVVILGTYIGMLFLILPMEIKNNIYSKFIKKQKLIPNN
ncbi:MAG: hypothetical protein GY710_02925 [Desulfobacteraceae bacterium]|nr:hypothetical protein [Desulfobacteraceae bacterium]